MLALFLFGALQSCSKKDDTSTPATQTAVLKFTANGTQYTFTGSAVSKYATGVAIINDWSPQHASFQASETPSATSNSIIIPFLQNTSGSNTLSVGTFTKTNFSADARIAGTLYGLTLTCSVTISTVTNNKYSGTFTATLKSMSTSSTINLTNGSFENLSYIP